MDQSKSSDNSVEIQLPSRSLSVEFYVGVFMIAALLAVAYLAVGLGGLELGHSSEYIVYAEFDNVSGLKVGAPVEIAGVPVGEVSAITLKDPAALVTLKLKNGVKLRDDDVAAVRTKGIIGDRYVKISRGASDVYIENGGTLLDTESVVDIEDIIGKIVHSLESDKGAAD
ncbi:MAG: MCE family protein [Candidatus Dadabacteria bacterium]|nr:MAG: MCE family protein [Candidatus Dadabacteria bacterium]